MASELEELDDAPLNVEVPEALSEATRKDLDETRRLLYMALVVNRTKRYNLAGTLVNAIKHHQRLDIDTDVLIDHVLDAVESGNESWVREQIDRICGELGD